MIIGASMQAIGLRVQFDLCKEKPLLVGLVGVLSCILSYLNRVFRMWEVNPCLP